MSSYTPPPEASANNMTEVADVDNIGGRCTFCGLYTFLPIICPSCGLKFCDDHPNEEKHNCSKKGLWSQRKRERELQASSVPLPISEKPDLRTSQQCSSPVCKSFVNTGKDVGVHCSTCNRTYCLKHRFPEEHDCKSLIPLGARPSNVAYQANKEKMKRGFGLFKAFAREKTDDLAKQVTPKPKSTSKAAQIAALNRMKRESTGDTKVPPEKRLYLHCSATDKVTKDGKPKEASMWFDQDWKVGRILDLVATKLGVENLNNSAQGTEKILRVFHVESGEVLEFSEKVSQRMISGNSVVLIRGLEV